jgi:hypothetical protein
MEPTWLVWARELQAIAQTGLTFASSVFDRERYIAIRSVAARMMARHSDADFASYPLIRHRRSLLADQHAARIS